MKILSVNRIGRLLVSAKRLPFELEELIKEPAICVFDLCRKADLLEIAEQFGVVVSRSLTKTVVWERLLAIKVLRPESPVAHSLGDEPSKIPGAGILQGLMPSPQAPLGRWVTPD